MLEGTFFIVRTTGCVYSIEP